MMYIFIYNYLFDLMFEVVLMCDPAITPENFNLRVLYIFKKKFNDENITKLHSHDFISLAYVLSGSCTYNINDTLYKVGKGDIIVLNSGVKHEKIIATGEEIMEFHIGFNNLFVKSLPRGNIIDSNISPVFNYPKYEEDFFKCCSEILAEQEKGGPMSELMLKALVMKFIAIFFKALYSNEECIEGTTFSFEPGDKAGITKAIISYIDENYMKEISLDKIARNMYLSPVYISKIFKEETGESPINYLIKIRLSRAKTLLEEGHHSVKDVAKSVGYADAYYFSKLFKKYYGYPPSECIKKQPHI